MAEIIISREQLTKESAEYYIIQQLFPDEIFTNWLSRTGEPSVFHRKGYSCVGIVDLSKGTCLRKPDKYLKKACKRQGMRIV